jgi:hypothetical protein
MLSQLIDQNISFANKGFPDFFEFHDFIAPSEIHIVSDPLCFNDLSYSDQLLILEGSLTYFAWVPLNFAMV